jgi:putative toxin-antitoxin system antitoxin component (TIGR02293 family)
MLQIHRSFTPPQTEHAVMPGANLLHMHARNPLELEQSLARGLSPDALQALRDATDLTLETIADIARISYESLNRYRKNAKPLPVEPSTRLYEFARLFERTLEIIPDRAQAQAWLREPVLALGNRSPLETLTSSLGAERVMQILERLEDGVF